jgi:hypothetical protein
MPGIEVLEKRKLYVLNGLYRSIIMHPLYYEDIIKMEISKGYPTPGKIMDKVNEKDTTGWDRLNLLDDAIRYLQQWKKILEMLQEKAEKQRIQDILKRNKDLLNENLKKLDGDMNEMKPKTPGKAVIRF